MIETIFFISGTLIGFGISYLSFKSGSKTTHQAYDVIYTTPDLDAQESEENEPKLTQEELYDWNEYNSSIKFQEFEEDEDNLEDKPN
jgi:hypothetical protein